MKKYYDGVRSFKSQLKQVERGNKDLQQAVADLKAREKDLERKVYREQQSHNEAVNSLLSLQSDYDDCMEFIQSIPKDLRKQLVERFEYLREMEQQQLDEEELDLDM